MSPVCVRLSPPGPATFAKPKSVTHTVPRRSRSKFEGLMSRCRMPCLCAYTRTSATCRPMLATLCQYVCPLPLLEPAPALLPGRMIDEDETVNESDKPEVLDDADDVERGAGPPAAG